MIKLIPFWALANLPPSHSIMSPSNSGRGSGSSAWPSMQNPPPDQNVDYCGSLVRSVPAVMNYVSSKTNEISTRRGTGGSDSALIGAIWDPTVVRVSNARLGACDDANNKLNLDRNGFGLWSPEDQKQYSTEALKKIDFLDQDQVVNGYYPICEQTVKEALQSQKSADLSPPIAGVFAFDHNVRSKEKTSFGTIRSKEDGTNIAPQIQNPAGLVHADYTRTSAPKRLDDLSNPPKLNDVLRPKLLAENRHSLLDPEIVHEALEGRRRYAFVNVWRNIDVHNPVKDCPLACVDASSTAMGDTRVFKIHYVDRIGENYFVCPSSSSEEDKQHRWYYYPDMTINEALLLKQWDSFGGIANGSERDGGDTSISTFTIHSAFNDATCPQGAPPRKSIEVRCIVLWEKI